jgi:hypothetical protein
MAQYKYYVNEKSRQVIAVSTYEGKNVKGTAKANPIDEFDIEQGKILAKARCDAKIAKRRMKRAKRKINEAQKILEQARAYYEKMSSYYDESKSAYTIAKSALDGLVETM